MACSELRVGIPVSGWFTVAAHGFEIIVAFPGDAGAATTVRSESKRVVIPNGRRR